MMPMGAEVNILDLQDKQVFENAFSTFYNFSIPGKNSMMCTNETDLIGPYKPLEIIVEKNKPTLENITKFLRFAPINVITHFDYTELVIGEYFFPKVDAILDCLKESCPNLRGLDVLFQGNSNSSNVFSYHLYNIVNYKNLETFVISMALEKVGIVKRLIQYSAKNFLIINGDHIKNLNSDIYALFNWDKTNHEPVRKLELFKCSFFNSLDLVSLLNLFKEELCHLIVDNVFPNSFYKCLENCQNIGNLDIRFKTEDSIKSLMGIANLQNLKELTLGNLHMAARPLVKKLFNHKSMKKLITVKFNYCPSIDDNILKIISLNCVSIEDLAIFSSNSGCKISDFGIMSILCSCPSLVRLELDNISGIDGYFLAFTRPESLCVELTNCSIKSPLCQDVYNKQEIIVSEECTDFEGMDYEDSDDEGTYYEVFDDDENMDYEVCDDDENMNYEVCEDDDDDYANYSV